VTEINYAEVVMNNLGMQGALWFDGVKFEYVISLLCICRAGLRRGRSRQANNLALHKADIL
jgi:hypothetical protein